MYSLNQIWRLFATALGFVIFGLFGVLFKIILLPYLSGSLKTQIKARRLVTKSWCWFVKYITLMGVVEAHFHGFEKLGRTGQLMLANHPSLLDVVFILSRVPDANCVVKADLLHNPAMSSQIRACGYVLNREDFDFVEQIDEILQTQSLLIFPEGTRTGWHENVKFHRGAVSLGLRSAKIITPIVVKMSPENYKKGQKWYQIPREKPVYHFVVGDDIDPQTWLAEKPLPIAARRLNDELQHYFNQQMR
ncbi:lysophospholipid acyltransferase family protein [Simonsiella muelleri]|uniref:lysophospholipid acyltransferase family protein n=1 Tax=Simonsiella muelleri TaxID=72 RepID=UPI0028D613A8|nr:lysophospholipid acyltransferase family protein [Simonsiella muelleri]